MKVKFNFQKVFNFNKPKSWLILANIFLVFFLILLSNFGVLPFEKMGDFGFFAVIFLILALYRPGWSFLFFIGTIALENINLAPESLGVNIRPYQFIGALTILAVLIRLVSRRLNFDLPKWNLADAAILVFAAAGFLSAIFTVETRLIASLQMAMIVASFAALYFLARLFIQKLEDIKKILPFFLSSSVVVILYGIWQNVRFVKGLENFETMPGRPNATFAEPDWLGIFLVLVLAVTYSLIYYLYVARSNSSLSIYNFQFSILQSISQFLIFKKILPKLDKFNENFNIENSMKIVNCKIEHFKLLVTSYWLLVTFIYLLLILTVSRSAWLGAITVSIMYLALCIMYFFRRNNKKVLWIPAFAGMTFIVAFGIIYIFNLTNFELGNRLQSTGTGLQEITVSCVETRLITSLPETICNLSELEQYGCRHINLEEIEKEKAQGNFIATIYRDDPNVNVRSETYKKSWSEIKKHPILGIGWGKISQVLGTDERGAGLNSSNIFLEVWLGSGIIGLMAFVFVWLNIFLGATKGLYHSERSKESQTNSAGKIMGFSSRPCVASRNDIITLNLFFLLSLFAILIPNLFNAGIMLGFLWIYLAIAQIKTI